MRMTVASICVITVLVAACRRDVESNTSDSAAISIQHSKTNIAFVPRFPGGVPAEHIPEWDKLNPACRGTSMSDIRPCMQSFVDYGHILGLVTLVDDRDLGTHVDAVGRFQPNSIFQIMSMTKPVVAVAIMKLVEQGKIPSVDTPVHQLRGFADFPYPQITIKQLLTHTSGMWYWEEPQPGIRTGIAPHLTNTLDKAPSITVRDKSLEFVARHYANPALYPLESTAPNYSNIGYTMLGWIVEGVSGMPFEQFVAREILDPLGMIDTFFFPDAASAEQRGRIVDLDRRVLDPLEYAHYDERRPEWVYPSPEGGLYSTAHDLRQFLALFRHRGEIPGSHAPFLSEGSVDRLMRDQIPEADYAPVAGVRCQGHVGRSLGFFVVRAPGCTDLPGLSPGTIQHTGRFATDFWYDPARDRIGVFLYQIVTNDDSTPSIAENDLFKQMLARIDFR